MKLEAIRYLVEGDGFDEITIQQRPGIGRDGEPVYPWSINLRVYVLDKATLEWEFEPMPSCRTVEYLARTRFASVEEAVECWKRHMGSVHYAAR